jgi:hypothetical protein
MPLKLYATHDEVPEANRANAIELKDGRWAVDEIDPNAVSPAAQEALEKERKAARDAEKARKDLEKQLADLKRAQDAAAHGITEEQLQQLRKEDAERRKPLEDEAAALRAENRRLKLTDRVKAAALAAGILNDRIDDAMLALDRRTDLVEGGDSIVVKDASGKVTSEPLADFLKTTFRKEKPWLYSGTGTSGDAGPGPAPQPGAQPQPADARQQQHRALVSSAL